METNIPENARAVLDNIHNRRTLPYTRMKADPIAEEHLRLLLEAANWAPTHKFTEPWRFTVFERDGRAKLAKVLGEVYRETCGDKFIEKKYQKTVTRPLAVPLVLGIAMHRADPPVIPEFEEILAVGCAVQNLHLAAHVLGIGGAWSTPRYCEHPKIRELLGLSGDDRCFGFFYLGYPQENWPKSTRKPVAQKVNRVSE